MVKRTCRDIDHLVIATMGFFGMVLKPGQKEAVEVPPGWCLQLCTAALEPAKAGKKVREKGRTS